MAGDPPEGAPEGPLLRETEQEAHLLDAQPPIREELGRVLHAGGVDEGLDGGALGGDAPLEHPQADAQAAGQRSAVVATSGGAVGDGFVHVGERVGDSDAGVGGLEVLADEGVQGRVHLGRRAIEGVGCEAQAGVVGVEADREVEPIVGGGGANRRVGELEGQHLEAEHLSAVAQAEDQADQGAAAAVEGVARMVEAEGRVVVVDQGRLQPGGEDLPEADQVVQGVAVGPGEAGAVGEHAEVRHRGGHGHLEGERAVGETLAQQAPDPGHRVVGLAAVGVDQVGGRQTGDVGDLVDGDALGGGEEDGGGDDAARHRGAIGPCFDAHRPRPTLAAGASSTRRTYPTGTP